MKHSFSARPQGRGQHNAGIRALAPRRRPGQGPDIAIERFINKAVVQEQAEAYVPQNTFASLGLDKRLVHNLQARAYHTPTPIQDQAMSSVLEGKDLIGLANTGTGKTAAFLLPIINSYITGANNGGTLIIVPTRELATQINDEFKAFGRGLGLMAAVCVGGESLHKQITNLRRGPHIVIGTPGRLKDLIMQDQLHLESCSTLVLDEADRMVDMGFIKDIRFILARLPEKKQALCFSATITRDVEDLIKTILKEPVKVSVRTRETADHVEQDIIRLHTNDQKVAKLEELLAQPEFKKVLIFGATKWGVQKIAQKLDQEGFKVEAIHGNKTQPQRQRALNAFKEDRLQALVATDVAARGLDIPNVSHVINFDIPNSYDDYVHRIGRTGRAGKSGTALTFVP
jgi:ATP-dependent RNA helicase RhlE